MSRLFTTEEILQNDASLLGFGTRYGVYQDGDVREPVDPASILLLLRDVDSDATTQINALFDQVRKQVPQNYHLRNLGFHFLRGRPRNLYGNANAIRIINEFNAAILKAQSLVTKYEDQREPSADPTWFVSSTLSSFPCAMKPSEDLVLAGYFSSTRKSLTPS